MITVIVCLFFLALLVLLRIFYENHTFVATRYDVDYGTNGTGDDWKIVFLSDLHNQEYGEGNEKLLRAVRDEKPDLILVGGDMLIRSTGEKSEKAARFMEQLPSIAPVYCANGNHEQKMKECEEEYGKAYQNYKKRLVDAGIHMLENEACTLKLGGQNVQIGGLEIPVSFFAKQVPWKHYDSFCDESPEQLMPEQFDMRPVKDGGPYKILLAHQALYAETYADWGMDLVLCGHLHGGVVRLPGIGGIISPQLTLFPKYSGEHSRLGESDIIVSKGLGGHSIPIRLFDRAEVVVICGRQEK